MVFINDLYYLAICNTTSSVNRKHLLWWTKLFDYFSHLEKQPGGHLDSVIIFLLPLRKTEQQMLQLTPAVLVKIGAVTTKPWLQIAAPKTAKNFFPHESNNNMLQLTQNS